MLVPLLMSSDSYSSLDLESHNNLRLHSHLDFLDLEMTQREIQILANLPSVRNARKRKAEERLEDLKRIGNLRPQVGKDGFQVLMNVEEFRPNEITVKTVDNTVIVEGKHEERQDEYSLISRHFLRKYHLPKDYEPKDVVSTLSSDGILTIKAQPPQKSLAERIIQIQQTGPAHLNVKENVVKETDKAKKN